MDTTYTMPVSAESEARLQFIKRTYYHVALAVLAFAVIESMLLRWSGATELAGRMTDGKNWLFVLLAFGGISAVADRWARSDVSPATQYLGLGTYVVAEAVIFVPLLLWAKSFGDADVIGQAATMTLLMVVGLTAVAFITDTDFSFLRGALCVGWFLAVGLIVASIFFGFGLGVVFSAAMVAFASASILYQTSKIQREYRTDQHVAAALALFASIALLFWYVVRIIGAGED
jgi:FtsH-binding integral membrane protein